MVNGFIFDPEAADPSFVGPPAPPPGTPIDFNVSGPPIDTTAVAPTGPLPDPRSNIGLPMPVSTGLVPGATPVPTPAAAQAPNVLTYRPPAQPQARGVPRDVDLGGSDLARVKRDMRRLQEGYGKGDHELGGSIERVKQALADKTTAESNLLDAEYEARKKGAAVLQEQRDQNQQARADLLRRTSRAKEFVDSKRQDYQSAIAEFRKMPSEDPERFWKDASGQTDWGQKALGAIAIALGAIGSAKMGGPNVALGIINKRINDDITAQRGKLKKKQIEIGQASDAVQAARQQYDDEFRQNKMAYALEIEKYKNVLDAKMTEINDPVMLSRMKATKNGLGVLQQKELQQIDVKNTQDQMGLLSAQVPVISAEGQLRAKEAALDAQKATGQVLPELPDGFEIDPKQVGRLRGTTPKRMDEIRQAMVKYNELRGRVNKLIQQRKDRGWSMLPEAINKDAQAGNKDLKELIISLKEFKKMGANFSEMEKALLDIPEDITKLGYFIPKMVAQRSSLDLGMDALANAYGMYRTQARAAKKGIEQPNPE